MRIHSEVQGSYAQLQAGTFKLEWLLCPFPFTTWGDDPMDQLNVKRGIEFWSKLHLMGRGGWECD